MFKTGLGQSAVYRSSKVCLYSVPKINFLVTLESEILGSSEASFSKFVLCKKNIFLVFCHLPICIISLMNAQKHVFGMYVFVYLVICVSKNQGLQ